jgi:Ion transport protein
MVCQDQTADAFVVIENFCLYFFTIEYGLRLLSCWAVSPRCELYHSSSQFFKLPGFILPSFMLTASHYRVAGILPFGWERKHKDDPYAEQPKYSAWYSMLKFIFQFRNVIDLAAILPFYVVMGTPNPNDSSSSSFVRILRLLRFLRVLRLLRLISFLKNVDVASELILETLSGASLLLSVFMFFVMVVVILFGCLIYLAEGGTFMVTHDYPDGAYLRTNWDGSVTETPFTSVAVGIYWSISAATGNGEFIANVQNGE